MLSTSKLFYSFTLISLFLFYLLTCGHFRDFGDSKSHESQKTIKLNLFKKIKILYLSKISLSNFQDKMTFSKRRHSGAKMKVFFF